MDDIDRLLHVRIVVENLYRAADRGDGVDNVRLDELFRAATGRSDDTNARRDLMVAIAMVARADLELAGLQPTDETITRLVASYLDGRLDDGVVNRVRRHPTEIAQAVRSWNRRGRPGGGERYVDKWGDVAVAIEVAGLGRISSENAHKIWQLHGVDWDERGIPQGR